MPRSRPGHGRVEAGARPRPVLPGGTPTRAQVPGALQFRRGEGMWFDSGLVYLVTTADHKIHVYDTATGALSVLYEAAAVPGAPLSDPDNIHVSPRSGDVFVAEDNGGPDPMDVCIIAPDGQIARFMKMTGPDHGGSEVIGLTFDPSGTRFYVGSQRYAGTGVVYEIAGPFRPYTPPPARRRRRAPPPPRPGIPIGLTIARPISIAALIRRGLAIALTLDKASTVRFRLTARITTKGRRRTVTLASATRKPGAGATTLRLKPTKAGAKILRARRRQITATLEVRITTPGAPSEPCGGACACGPDHPPDASRGGRRIVQAIRDHRSDVRPRKRLCRYRCPGDLVRSAEYAFDRRPLLRRLLRPSHRPPAGGAAPDHAQGRRLGARARRRRRLQTAELKLHAVRTLVIGGLRPAAGAIGDALLDQRYLSFTVSIDLPGPFGIGHRPQEIAELAGGKRVNVRRLAHCLFGGQGTTAWNAFTTSG